MALDSLSPSRLCRLCLAFSHSVMDIVENETLSEMLTALTAIKIESNDEISTVMCLKCRLNLNLAYKIQQNMIRAEERFRHLPPILKSQYIEHQTMEHKNLVKTEETLKIEDEIEIKECLIRSQNLGSGDKQPDEHSCEVCSKVFPTKQLLKKHKYNHKKSKCPKCDKELTASNLHTHMEIHDDHPQICDICGVTLKTKANLRQHKYYSHNAARHKCKYCDKVFVKRSNRDAHERKEHLDEANFVCDTCGKKFYSSRHLTIHVRMTHLKLRPYVCEFCNAAFSSSFAMKTHRRQHTNETPYRCEVCGEGFRQKVSLRSHKKSKHNIVEKETCHCMVCGKGFASKTALYTHQRIH